ncbi:hypothetical protein WI460_16955 [Gemmatimonadota bacterium Y43]|uniref:hypothetical protein n=1 Tax=Gaopeijia maritima TaxID=3119007 RepID=UPI00327ADD8C
MSQLPAPRRYGEEEVSRLLKRATELQRAQPTSPEPSGLTLEELEEIALEAGIDPALLRRAADELDTVATPLDDLGSTLAGAPTRIVLERVLDHEVPATAFGPLVPIIQVAAEAPGQASQVGRSLTWHSHNPSNPRTLQVVVTVHRGQTTIRIEERYGGLVGAIFGGVMGGVGGGVGMGLGGALAGITGSAALAVAFPVGVLAASYGISRFAFQRIVRRRHKVARALMESIVEQLASSRSLPPGTGEGG